MMIMTSGPKVKTRSCTEKGEKKLRLMVMTMRAMTG